MCRLFSRFNKKRRERDVLRSWRLCFLGSLCGCKQAGRLRYIISVNLIRDGQLNHFTGLYTDLLADGRLIASDGIGDEP